MWGCSIAVSGERKSQVWALSMFACLASGTRASFVLPDAIPPVTVLLVPVRGPPPECLVAEFIWLAACCAALRGRY